MQWGLSLKRNSPFLLTADRHRAGFSAKQCERTPEYGEKMKIRSAFGLLSLLFFISYFLPAPEFAAWGAVAAYWRFEEGSAGDWVSHGASVGVWSPDILDHSGSGNHLSVWAAGGYAGYAWTPDVPKSAIPRTGQTNNLSVKNTGSYPGMWTQTGSSISTMSPSAFTIEASFKLENGTYRTIVGRDSYGTASISASLAALYFQALPNNALAVKFCDVSGFWHQAVSAEGIFQSFDYSTNPNGAGVPWYSMAAVSDGSTLSLYLLEHGSDAGYQLIASTNMTLSGSPNTALTVGAGDGSDWDAGNWSVGRGLYNGVHTDRAYGFIDEVRICNTALQPSEFLFYEHVPAGLIISPQNLTLTEQDSGHGDIYFSLAYQPAGSVVLEISELAGRGQVVLDKSVLTFTQADWNIPQAVRITAVDDADVENAEHPVPLSVVVSSLQDPLYDGLETEPVVVMVADNECGAWGYAPGDYNRDCIVNLYDFVNFARYWMDCSDPEGIGCINFYP